MMSGMKAMHVAPDNWRKYQLELNLKAKASLLLTNKTKEKEEEEEAEEAELNEMEEAMDLSTIKVN